MIHNLTKLQSSITSSNTAITNTSQGNLIIPEGAAKAAIEGANTSGIVSSLVTGKAIGTGPSISKIGRNFINEGLLKTSDSASSRYQASSNFPITLDSFTPPTNDSNQISKASDFNTLSSSIRVVEQYLQRILKSSSGDISDRLSNRSFNQAVGIPPNAYSLLGVTGGTRVSLQLRKPMIGTFSATIPVSGWSSYASTVITLTTDQKTALGISSSIQEVSGLVFFTSCKFQSPDPTVFSSSDPIDWDPASLSGKVSARLDDSGVIQLFLSSGTYTPLGVPDSRYYTKSPGNLPYLAPGLWFVTITILRSIYAWS